MNGGRGEIRALTGVRALAAAWVVLFHFAPVAVGLLPELEALAPLADAGFIGVDLFFILSGFILAYTYAATFRTFEAGAYAKFLWYRLARIYPLHLATLLALLAIVTGADLLGIPIDRGLNFHQAGFWENVLLVQSWSVPGRASWNVPAWSISSEWLAYLCFPFLIPAVMRIRRPAHVLTAIGTLMAVFLVVTGNAARADGYELALPRIAVGFITGCLLYRLSDLRAGVGWRWGVLTPLLSVGIALVAASLVRLGVTAYFAVPLLAILVFGLAHTRGRYAELLGHPVLTYGGKVSYSLYLTHGITLLVLERLLPAHIGASAGRFGAGALLLGYVLCIAGVAIAGYHLVEEPARHAMRRAWARLRSTPEMT